MGGGGGVGGDTPPTAGGNTGAIQSVGGTHRNDLLAGTPDAGAVEAHALQQLVHLVHETDVVHRASQLRKQKSQERKDAGRVREGRGVVREEGAGKQHGAGRARTRQGAPAIPHQGTGQVCETGLPLYPVHSRTAAQPHSRTAA